MMVRKQLPKGEETAKRGLELACYLTHFDLSPVLLNQLVKIATKLAYKMQCYITANSLARRGMALCAEGTEDRKRFSSIIRKCQQKGDDALELAYDPERSFVVCQKDFVPLEPTSAVRSPYSGAFYGKSHAGEICEVDGMCEIGKKVIGLVLCPTSGGEGF